MYIFFLSAIFLGFTEISSIKKSPFFQLHWCMLHAFWTIAALHPPKMGTFLGSQHNNAIMLTTPNLLRLHEAMGLNFIP
jgi:hypothetical protein